MCRRLAANFEKLFCATFSRSKNAKFLEKLAVRLARSEWARLLDMIEGAARKQSAAQQQQPPAAQAAGGAEDGAGNARRRAWAAIVAEAAQLREDRAGAAAAMALEVEALDGECSASA